MAAPTESRDSERQDARGLGGVPMSERNPLVVVTDTSGSMREHGKAMLARNLIAHILVQARLTGGACQLGAPMVILWGAEVLVLQQPWDQDLPCFTVGRSARAEPLLTSLTQLLRDEGTRQILLLSDGHLGRENIALLKAWRHKNPKLALRALALGPDAAPAALAKIADPGGVFAPEDLMAALASFRLPQASALPVSLAEVVDTSARGPR